jgi:hypothetical protein
MTTMLETSSLLAAEPREFSVQDGQYLQLRRVAQDVTVLLTDTLLRLSDQTRCFRYFTFRLSSLEEAWSEAERITRRHAGNQVDLVVTTPQPGDNRRAIAAARSYFSPALAVSAAVMTDAYRAFCPEEYTHVEFWCRSDCPGDPE